MKRILLLFLFLCGVSAFAQKPIYVYFNDGTFKAFLSSEIDHISLSPANDNPESEMFLQEFWTTDSVYRYPVHTIDSIGSYMPPTKFKDEAIDLSGDLLDYVISADTTHVFLQLDTPANILPQIGQMLGYPTMDEIFPYGFAGEVKSVSRDATSIVVNCTPVMLDKVFDTFYLVVTSEGFDESKSNTKAQRAPLKEGNVKKLHFDLPSHTISYTTELSKVLNENETLALKGSFEVAVTLSNAYDVTAFYVVNNDMGCNVQLSIIGHHDVEVKSSVYGGITYARDFPIRSLGTREHIGYGVFFYENPGIFVNASGTVSFSSKGTHHFVSAGSYEFSSIGKAVLKPSFAIKPNGADLAIEGTLDGRFAIGGFIETGFTFLDPFIDKVALRGEIGAELTGSAVLFSSDVEKSKHDTSTYEKLKKSPITLNFFTSTGIDVGIAIWNTNFTLRRDTYPPIWQRDLVPTFSNAKLTQNVAQYKSVDASVEAHGNCLFSVPVSFVLFDKNEKEVGNYVFSKNYTNKAAQFQHTFNNLGLGEYTLYPQVSFLGFDLLASPSVADQLIVPVPIITKLYQVGYSKEGFNYDGRTYKYKFDVIVDTQVESLDGVDDWGFFYKSPTGQDIKKSFMQQGTSAEYMFSIFSNHYTTSSSIHTYIKYNGNEIISGSPYLFEVSQPTEPEEPEDFETIHNCPDSNHPHIIDLGLPSGTKWACCNVGAHAPEEYGGYYAWGELGMKEDYDWSTYIHTRDDNYWSLKRYCTLKSFGVKDDKTELEPEHDAAYMNWGAGWRIPSDGQLTELYTNCSWTWNYTKKGFTVVGPNKSSLFLPAAGCYCGGVLEGIHETGCYWSRSLCTDFPSSAYSMFFGRDDYIRLGDDFRSLGFSIRPVRE